MQSMPSCGPLAGGRAPAQFWGDAMRYDAIVIGSGQGGNPLSYALAERGWSVALIEKNKLGGTCVNTGCTPTKTMIASAQVAHYARDAARWGVIADNVRVDLPAVVAKKNAVVQTFRGGHERRVVDRRLVSMLVEAGTGVAGRGD